jgi:hypothetical protein
LTIQSIHHTAALEHVVQRPAVFEAGNHDRHVVASDTSQLRAGPVVLKRRSQEPDPQLLLHGYYMCYVMHAKCTEVPHQGERGSHVTREKATPPRLRSHTNAQYQCSLRLRSHCTNARTLLSGARQWPINDSHMSWGEIPWLSRKWM